MAAFRTGDTLVWYATLLNSSGVGLTGKTSFLAAVTAKDPANATFAPTISEIGNGTYKATFVSTIRGVYYLHWRYSGDSGQAQQDFADPLYVDDDLAVAIPGSYAAGTLGANIGAVTAARAAKLDNIGVATITVTAPVASGGDVTVIIGDDYLNADGRALAWTSTGWPSLTSGSATLTIKLQGVVSLTKAMTVVDASHVRVDLTKTDTASLVSGGYRFAVVATLADASIVTLVNAGLSVQKAGV